MFTTHYVNTSKTVVLFYVKPLGYTKAGAPRRALVTNVGIFQAVPGSQFIYGLSESTRDRWVTLTLNGSGKVSHLADDGPASVMLG